MAGLFGSSSSTAATQQNNTLGDLSKDVIVKNPPEDSISDLAFSTQSDHLAVASWDNKVRIYEVLSTGEAEPRAVFEHEGPVLSCHWSKVSCKA
jgi:mRNA export factor